MRRDAMFQSVTSGMSKDHILVSCVTREGEILNALRRNLPNVRAVHVPHTSCGAFTAYISMKKIADGEPQTAIMATLGTEFYTKHVIVVDDDVDIFDTNDVMWAVATRVRPDKDIFFIPGAKGAILDPTSDPENFTVTKMGIDATRPAGRDFAERLVISDDQRAQARALLEAAGVEDLTATQLTTIHRRVMAELIPATNVLSEGRIFIKSILQRQLSQCLHRSENDAIMCRELTRWANSGSRAADRTAEFC